HLVFGLAKRAVGHGREKANRRCSLSSGRYTEISYPGTVQNSVRGSTLRILNCGGPLSALKVAGEHSRPTFRCLLSGKLSETGCLEQQLRSRADRLREARLLPEKRLRCPGLFAEETKNRNSKNRMY